jgi:hypothetical protein
LRYMYIPATQLTYEKVGQPIENTLTLPKDVKLSFGSVNTFNTSCTTIEDANKNVMMSIWFTDDQGNDIEHAVPIWRYLVKPSAFSSDGS